MRKTALICALIAVTTLAHAGDITFVPNKDDTASSAAGAIETSGTSPLSTDNGNETWITTRGEWSHAGGNITGAGNFDNRAINQTPQPRTFRWPLKIDLQQGWSAGALVWSDASGQEGYAVRLDARQNALYLEKIGPWPEVKVLDTFPWSCIDGSSISLDIQTGEDYIRVFAPAISNYAILEALKLEPAGLHTGLQILDAVAAFSTTPPQQISTATALRTYKPKIGEYTQIYNPSIGENSPWYINDHTFARTDDAWHLIGITHAQPAAPLDELNFAHAKSPTFPGSLQTWKKLPYALETDRAAGESLLWAPHIIKRDNLYYMFYCAGSAQGGAHFRIHLATSEDCTSWTRYENNPVFQDTFDTRDPMVLEDNGTYYMYYTANMGRNESHHTVNLRTSKDLLHWSPARIVFVHPQKGTWGGETESPFVVKYEDHFYLFIGPARAYHSTAVYRSSNPLHWRFDSEITSFPSHAAEVIKTDDDKWYVSGAGWDREGVYVAPMEWELEK